MKRSKSSKRWLKEHFSDPFVKRAHAEGARSRATYKLVELIDRDRLIQPGMVVVDLGAAPGGWSQTVRQRMGGAGTVIALDILPLDSIAGVTVIEGDFADPVILAALERALDGAPVDLVLSDLAPNMSGVASVDQARAMALAELGIDFAARHLKPGGTLVLKLFQGAGFDALLLDLRRHFERVAVRKPKASRPRSAEVYAVATGWRG